MLRSMAFMLCGALVGWSLASSPARVGEELGFARPLPTTRQALVLAALDQPSESGDFQKQPLHDVVGFLIQKHDIGIQLDGKALRNAGIGDDTPVTCTLHGVSLRSTLKLLLGELDLTYVVGDGYLLITSKTEAENKLHFRVYPVDDLVTTDSEFRSPLDPGGKAGADFENLITVITSIVEPTTWDEVGGPGSISAFGNSRALAVSQTDEIQEEVAALLASLRRVRDKQIAAAKSQNHFRFFQPYDTNDQRALEVRVYRFFQAPSPAMAAAPANAPKPPFGTGAADQQTSAEASHTAADDLAAARLDAWTKVIARLAPEMIAPASWEPAGEGQIRAVSGTIVVRQTADIQYQVGKLIYEMMVAGTDSAWYPLAPVYRCFPSVRLKMPPAAMKWPQEAEPPPRGSEACIIAALEEECDFDFAQRPWSEVLATVAERHHIPIHVDYKALERAYVAGDAPITRSFRHMTLKAALKLMLDELDLVYVIRDEVVLVTSKCEAENMLVTRVYPVFDLVVRRPGASARSPALDFQTLIENITANLAPTTWDEVGGPGAIQAFTNAGALVISQTAETHEQIASLLQTLREAAVPLK